MQQGVGIITQLKLAKMVVAAKIGQKWEEIVGGRQRMPVAVGVGVGVRATASYSPT